MAIRDTTVYVTKATPAGGVVYRGGYHVVTKTDAKALVDAGHARILCEEKVAEVSDDKSTFKAKAAVADKTEGV